MKKLWEIIKDKVLQFLVYTMLTTGGFFLWNVGKDIWYLPETVKHLKQLHQQDSARAILYMNKVDSMYRFFQFQVKPKTK